MKHNLHNMQSVFGIVIMCSNNSLNVSWPTIFTTLFNREFIPQNRDDIPALSHIGFKSIHVK